MDALRKQHTAALYRTAAERKEQVKKAIAGLDLPNNPLDQLIDLLGGPDHVAEMTGALQLWHPDLPGSLDSASHDTVC